MGTPTRYQRVTNATDYALTAEDGTPFPLFIRLDGSDDWLQTNTITPGTDKVAVFAGVRKLSDAADGLICEFSDNAATRPRAFNLGGPSTLGPAVSYGALLGGGPSGGSGQRSGVGSNGFPAPITNVVQVSFDSAGAAILDEIKPRINGVLTQSIQFGDAVTTGNFLAYPLYIGRRAGTSFPFNGHIHQLIVRFGPNLDAATIANAEKFVGTKTGITL
jgi:hypothetical protein